MSTVNFQNLVGPKKDAVWRYAKLLDLPRKTKGGALRLAPPKSGLAQDRVGEGWQISSLQSKFTPLERVGEGDFYVKREDQSPTGSHKFRGLVYQLSKLRQSDKKLAVLSSSGNAAIAASVYSRGSGAKILIFLSEKTPTVKLAALNPDYCLAILSTRPLRLAKYAIAKYRLPDLRPSRDDNAIVGFQSLGFEIFEQAPDAANIFTFVTSGASLLGIFTAYKKLAKLGIVKKLPRLFAVTCSGKLAGELAGQESVRQTEIRRACEERGGGVITVTDKEIALTKKNYRYNTSNEGLAALAAALKVKPASKTVVIFTGRNWPEAPVDLNKFLKAESFQDVDKIVAQSLRL